MGFLHSRPYDYNMGIYIHIPFCKQACYYCNFHFSTNLQYKQVLLDCIGRELLLQKQYIPHMPISSIYFGGGTPSLLSLVEVENLLNVIFAHFPVESGVEITLEANPDDVNLDKLKGWYALGINRLSIGIQSFNDHVLRYMHRVHDSKTAKRSIQLARQAQFNNLNIDLIYASACSTIWDWQADLKQAFLLEPEHISAYCLTIEPKTVFGYWQEQNKLIEQSEELVVKQFELLLAMCYTKGYIHYEVSNFCKPEKFSKHNVNYWKKGVYLGVGPGAHSYNGIQRQWNIANNALYVKALQQGNLPYTAELLTLENHINEYIMTSLRTCWGCDFDWLYQNYAVDLLPKKLYPKTYSQ